MKNILIVIGLMISITASTQQNERTWNGTMRIDTVHYYDTIKAELRITNSKINSLQSVPGYVIKKNGKCIGYLSRLKKPLPKKVTVWSWY